MSTSSRRGFTLVELLIVIAIIGVLMGLLIPAVQAARERSRQATCSSNLRQIALAMQSSATNQKGVFPGWAYNQDVQSGTTKTTMTMPWTVKVLANLDEQTLREQILTDSDGSGFPYAAPPKLEVFNCPSDANTNPTLGTLSFVVNSGMPDPLDVLTGNEVSDVKGNGVCHDLRFGRKGPSVRYPADLKDGADTTLLLSENVHKDPQVDGHASTWLGSLQEDTTKPADMSYNPEQRFGMVWPLPSLAAAPGPLAPTVFEPINRDSTDGGPYVDMGARFARPSSEHPELFIAAFCGANVRDVRETIDFRVYQQLMTPDGMKAAYYDSPTVSIEKGLAPNKRFMNPPLNDADY